MDRMTSLGMLQAGILGNNIITYSTRDNTGLNLSVQIENQLSISITNSDRMESMTLTYDDSRPVPGILDRKEYPDQPRIYLYFPAGDREYHMTTPELSRLIDCSVSRGWKVIPCDEEEAFLYGRYWCVIPDMRESGRPVILHPGDSIILQFSSIITYRSYRGMSCVCIDACVEPQSRVQGYLPLYIDQAKPAVRNFRCSQNHVGILDKVKFNWEVLGNVEQTRFYPGCKNGTKTAVLPKAETECVVYESTDYTLRVTNGEDMVYGCCPVLVEEPVIEEFKTTDGRTQYQYGDPVIFYIRLKNTNHCYINRGIGRIDLLPKWNAGYPVLEGTQQVECRAKLVDVCVSCLGRHGLIKKSVRITVTDYLSLENVVYERKYDTGKKTFHYKLHWVVDNAIELEIRTSDQVERSKSVKNHPVLSGSVEFEDASLQALSITIIAAGAGGQSLKEERKCIEH